MGHRIAVLALDEVYSFDLGVPSRIFDAALDERGNPYYDTVVCTLDGNPVRTSAGYRMAPEHGGEAIERADTVIVPPTRNCPAVGTGTIDPRLAAALRAAAARGARIMSICTGAFVLAAAGLLDRRPATTHWIVTDRFRALFPTVRLDPDVLFVDDGDVLTSAGAAAGIDLCLHMVRRDHGSEAANGAARRCVVPPWREGGQAQYIDRPIPEMSAQGTAPARAWALSRLDRPINLGEWAAAGRMSVRTFTRRFREETGQSPAQWLIQQRVDRARHLLETTGMPVERVARETGFGTAMALRKRMRAVVGVAPIAYRRAFRTP